MRSQRIWQLRVWRWSGTRHLCSVYPVGDFDSLIDALQHICRPFLTAVGGGRVGVLVRRVLRDTGCPRLREGFVGGADNDARVVSRGVVSGEVGDALRAVSVVVSRAGD